MPTLRPDGWHVVLHDKEYRLASPRASRALALERYARLLTDALAVVTTLLVDARTKLESLKPILGPGRTDRARERAKQFAAIWNRAASAREAAEQLGRDVRSASRIASQLRRKGVKLKRFTAWSGAK